MYIFNIRIHCVISVIHVKPGSDAAQTSCWSDNLPSSRPALICIERIDQTGARSSHVSSCGTCVFTCDSRSSRSRVSWVLSEASSWAEHEHKRCFHSALRSAVWILPRALISMGAAVVVVPGFCDCMCASTHTYIFINIHPLLPHPHPTPLSPTTVESSCLHPISSVGFFPLIYFSILFSLWLSLHPHLYCSYSFYLVLFFFSPHLYSHSLSVVFRMIITPPAPFFFTLFTSCFKFWKWIQKLFSWITHGINLYGS